MLHDAMYYDYSTGEDVNLNNVDTEFEECARKQGLVGNIMASAVSVSRMVREWSSSPADDSNMKQTKTPTLRGSKPTSQKKAVKAKAIGMQLSAPAAISSVFTTTPTRTKNIKNGISASGKEFLGNVECLGVSTFGLGKSALINPSYFYGGVLGQLARSYSRYRFTKLLVHYIPKVPTSLAGQIVLCSQENVTMPALAGESTTFIQRALVSGDGVMAPVWTPCKMQVRTDNKYRTIDAFTNSDIDSNILCEVQCYTQAATSGQVGFLWVEYECELIDNRLEPHLTNIPVFTGPGFRVALQDTSATPTINTAVSLADTAGSLTTWPNGTIYRMVIDLQGFVPATGTTAANAWQVITRAFSAAASVNSAVSTNVIVGGMTIYLMVLGSELYAYSSIEAAIAGSSAGQLQYKTTGSSKATVVGDVTVVRFGPAVLDDVQ